MSFVTIWVFFICHNFIFLNLSQFEFLGFVTVWGFEFCHNWVFVFCLQLSFRFFTIGGIIFFLLTIWVLAWFEFYIFHQNLFSPIFFITKILKQQKISSHIFFSPKTLFRVTFQKNIFILIFSSQFFLNKKIFILLSVQNLPATVNPELEKLVGEILRECSPPIIFFGQWWSY